MISSSLIPKTGRAIVAGALLAVSAVLAGCSADFAGTSSGLGGGASIAGAKLGGSIHGGQQPVSGATVQLWSVGTSGYGSTASALGTAVATNSNGGFTYGTFTCPANSYTYVTAAGGNPQTGTGSTTNNAIALMAALGPCSGLTSSTFINVNEVTTVAAVWAMAPFGSVTTGTALSSSTASTPSDTFGTSANNVQGIANSMGVSGVLASVSTGNSPGSNLTGNISNVEYWQVNALADILALCVNSTGVTSTSCSPVVTATTASGGTAPADTIQMALYLAKNPTAGLTLLSQISATSPFQPYDTSVNDWTLGYSVPTGTSNTRWLAIDGFGNAWVATGGAIAYELSPIGDIIDSPTSYTVTGATSATTFGNAYQVAIDTANNAWFTDNTNQNIVEITGSTSAGGAGGAASTAVSTSGVATSGLEGIAVDGSNNVWATVASKNTVGVLSGTTSLTTGGTLTGSPFGIAIDLSNQSTSANYTVSGGHSFIYALNSGGCATGTKVNGATTGTVGGSISMDFTGAATVNSTAYTAGQATPYSFIVDSSCNNVTNVPTSTTLVANGTSVVTTAHVFMSVPYGIAVDNSNDVWVVNQNYTTVAADTTATDKYSLSKLTTPNFSASTGGTTAGSGPTNFAFTGIYGGGLASPFYLAMDGAGAAWVGNSTTPTGGESTATGGLSGFANTGTAISPSTGLFGGTYAVTSGTTTTTSARKYVSPRGVAVDGSGNVWVSNTGTGGTYVTVTVGVATPTVTPLATGIKAGTLASKPN